MQKKCKFVTKSSKVNSGNYPRNHTNIQQIKNYYYSKLTYLLILILMEATKPNQGYFTQIRGRNFYGRIQLTGQTLSLDVTEFLKGCFYIVEFSHLDLQKDFKRFLIFKKVHQLFQELVDNQRLQISDQNTLIVPVDVTYKNKKFELKIQLPLLQKKFNNQAQKMQNLFQIIERLNRQKIKMEGLLSKLIKFKGDESNQRYNTYQVSQDSKTIKKIGDAYTCYNHCCSLKSKGSFYFKAKIIKAATAKYMFFGICTREIQTKIDTDLYSSPFFMAFLLANGNIYGNNTSYVAASGYTIIQGQSVIKVEIDMSNNQISWFHNQAKLYGTAIPKQFSGLAVYPMVSFYSNGDSIEFIDQ